jgi:hypothetical protein
MNFWKNNFENIPKIEKKSEIGKKLFIEFLIHFETFLHTSFVDLCTSFAFIFPEGFNQFDMILIKISEFYEFLKKIILKKFENLKKIKKILKVYFGIFSLILLVLIKLLQSIAAASVLNDLMKDSLILMPLSQNFINLLNSL